MVSLLLKVQKQKRIKKDQALDVYTNGISIAQKLNDQQAKSELMGVN